MRVVVMGPSGAGKSTVGRALAESLGALFVDGDDLHPAENVAKMAAGEPLNDHDRLPWLRTVGERLHAEGDIVIACSALKRSYRDEIRTAEPAAYFVELAVGRGELETRMRTRGEHFMPVALLDSQLQTLEPLGADEHGIRIGDGVGVDDAVRTVAAALGAGQSLR